MPLPVFPAILINSIDSIAINPDVQFKEMVEDSTIRSEAERGLILTRRRANKDRRIFNVKYQTLPNDQKVRIENFSEITVKQGCLHFEWTHPATRLVKVVRFVQLPNYEAAGMHNNQVAWNIDFVLQEL